MGPPKIDEIGPWSEVKLEILKRYATEYSKILANQRDPSFWHVYIDAFAGAGFHLSRRSGEMVPGSPLNALEVKPPFREYHLIDLDGDKVTGLRELVGDRQDVHVHHGDCNAVLLDEVFPNVRYEDYKRGLCILDPYGLHLNWNVIQTAGSKLRSLDVFINFPIYDININVLHHDPETVSPMHVGRMNAFWGDDSWRKLAYEETSPDLFGNVDVEKVSNSKFAAAFRERLKKVAGFKRVPEPLPMINKKGSIVYYLFFASQKDTAEHIVRYIFDTFGKH
ncbi:MAG: three-Cys-motif partner protein TcmP [Terriglobales bacterium]|jgi:three-Cys-motif partner protein